jgi:hypothetical protein
VSIINNIYLLSISRPRNWNMQPISNTFIIFYLIYYCTTTITCCSACHPQCTYLCDSPVCQATCVAIVSPPTCTTFCLNNFTPSPPCEYHCSNVLTSDVCALDQCPVSEIQCSQLDCGILPNNVSCQIQCEPPQSGWKCSKPKNCPKPICELQCEQPTCLFSSANDLISISFFQIELAMVFTSIGMLFFCLQCFE